MVLLSFFLGRLIPLICAWSFTATRGASSPCCSAFFFIQVAVAILVKSLDKIGERGAICRLTWILLARSACFLGEAD